MNEPWWRHISARFLVFCRNAAEAQLRFCSTASAPTVWKQRMDTPGKDTWPISAVKVCPGNGCDATGSRKEEGQVGERMKDKGNVRHCSPPTCRITLGGDTCRRREAPACPALRLLSCPGQAMPGRRPPSSSPRSTGAGLPTSLVSAAAPRPCRAGPSPPPPAPRAAAGTSQVPRPPLAAPPPPRGADLLGAGVRWQTPSPASCLHLNKTTSKLEEGVIN